MKSRYSFFLKFFTSGLVLLSSSQAITWTGGAGDSLWTTAANWDSGVVPAIGDTVTISNGDTVDLSAGLFVPNNTIVNVSGSSQLTNSAAAVRLNSGVTINFSAGSGMSGAFLDLNRGAVNFLDGAALTASGIQHRGDVSYGFTLTPSGFNTLTPGQLYDAGNEDWSNVTFNVDVSTYDYTNGITVDLIDYLGHQPAYNGLFNPIVNIIDGGAGLSGALSFDSSSSLIRLTVDPPGNDAPVASAQSLTVNGTAALPITLFANDIEGDPLTYSIVSSPTKGTLTGSPPNLTYIYTGTDFSADSFTFKANDGTDDSNIATINLTPVPRTASDFWGSVHPDIIDPATLNPVTHTSWVEGGITMSRVCFELGTLSGSQHTSTPVIAAYFGMPTGGTNLPGLVQIHGGGQRGSADLAKYWAEQGYASISINWGGLDLSDPDEPAGTHPNTNWDGIIAGFVRTGVTQATHKADCDPVAYADGQTLHSIPHPLNSSWILNSYAARRAITYLQNLPEVDDTKIGVLGWSMGGRTTMVTSTDPRITVLAPGVGGCGYLYEDWWGLPGTKRSSSTWQDFDLFKTTVDNQSYWPDVSAPLLFLQAANDFNSPFDLVAKGMSTYGSNTTATPADAMLVAAPQYNHRLTASEAASRVHWIRHHLIGDLAFPEISDSELELTTTDGVPTFKVYPDASSGLTITNVDIFYGIDRDPRTRFWRDAGATNAGTHWEAKLPVFNVDEMLSAYAVITYDVGFSQSLTPGFLPTNLFNVASKVQTYYPAGIDTTGYPLQPALDTEIAQVQELSSATLVANGLEETAEVSYKIDDFSTGLKDWYVLNDNSPVHWQYYTRKISDPSWRGGTGAQLAVDINVVGNTTLLIRLVDGQWNEGSTNTYYAYVPVTTGLNNITLNLSDFTLADGVTTLTSWSNLSYIGFMGMNAIGLTPTWSGGIPTFSDFRWIGGETVLDNNVPTTWLYTYSLARSNEQTREDTDGDGCLDWEEFIAGTDPTDSNSCFITCASSDGVNYTLSWTPVTGKIYDIEYSPDLGTVTPWQPYQTTVPYTAGVDVSINIPMTPLNNGVTRFYRVSVR